MNNLYNFLSSLPAIVSEILKLIFYSQAKQEGRKEAELSQSQATLKGIQDAKKTSDEISKLTPDQRREYARTGVWEPEDLH